MAHVAVIGMRLREPKLARPFKLPWNVGMWGREIPLTAVIGGLGTLGVWVMIVVNNPFGRWIGLAWLALGTALFVVYRRQIGLPIAAPGERAEPGWTRQLIGEPRVGSRPTAPPTVTPEAPEAATPPSAALPPRWQWRMALRGVVVWLVLVGYFVAADLVGEDGLQWAYWAAPGALAFLAIGLLWRHRRRLALVATTVWGGLSALGYLVLDALDAGSWWSPLAVAPLAVLLALAWRKWRRDRGATGRPGRLG